MESVSEPLPAYNAATDPYCESEPVLDTLADRPPTTPLMTTWSRIGVLVLVAAMLFQRRVDRHAGGDVVEGLEFPDEIKIHGYRQSFMGAGAGAGFVAGVYLGRDSDSRQALSAFANASPAELQGGSFIRVLADATHRQSLLLQWTAPTSAEAALALLGDAAGPAATALVESLGPLLGPQVPEGADLFLTCAAGSLHLAYAGTPTPHVRNTAKVGATLNDAAACPALFGTFLGDGFLGDGALRQGVVDGYSRRSSVWT